MSLLVDRKENQTRIKKTDRATKMLPEHLGAKEEGEWVPIEIASFCSHDITTTHPAHNHRGVPHVEAEKE